MKVKELEQRILYQMMSAMPIAGSLYTATEKCLEKLAQPGRKFEVEEEVMFPDTLPAIVVPLIYFSESQRDITVRKYEIECGMHLFTLGCIDRRIRKALRELAKETDICAASASSRVYVIHGEDAPVELCLKEGGIKWNDIKSVPADAKVIRCVSDLVPLKNILPYIAERILTEYRRDDNER